MLTISTNSVEEGLDFACSLISNCIIVTGETNPEKANEILFSLASFNQFRYVGELLLALHKLVDLGKFCEKFNNEIQYWKQLHWVALELNLTSDEFKEVGIPTKFT
ncbi:MAG: hypothetical protein HRU38_15350 [Saccharospirillaceae bacterium]|nr:hypothetical protein [Pseudomonadales bacterium]NRB80017.1 hypothetical protein [Saccharospirillaceae bacterium]